MAIHSPVRLFRRKLPKMTSTSGLQHISSKCTTLALLCCWGWVSFLYYFANSIVPFPSVKIVTLSHPVPLGVNCSTKLPRVFFLNSDPFDAQYGRRTILEDPDSYERRQNPLSSTDELVLPPQQITSLPQTFHLANGTEHTQQCEPIQEWQIRSYPTCNLLHELDIASDTVKYNAHGSIRSVWKVSNNNDNDNDNATDVSGSEDVILKMILFHGNHWEPQRYESHRRDAMATERLTSSPHIVDIYGYCAQSCLNEIMVGTLSKSDSSSPPLDKLLLARDAAEALADVHSAGGSSIPTIVHRDITHRNFLLNHEGVVKLNDFNVARFPEWDRETETLCPFDKGDCGPYRSPEECRFEALTEKIDVYALGNVFYYILTKEQPFQYPWKLPISQIKQSIKEGNTSIIPSQYEESEDEAVIGFIQLIRKCWSQDPNDRPSAHEISAELSEIIEKIENLEQVVMD